jgi:hypothetical protein
MTLDLNNSSTKNKDVEFILYLHNSFPISINISCVKVSLIEKEFQPTRE